MQKLWELMIEKHWRSQCEKIKEFSKWLKRSLCFQVVISYTENEKNSFNYNLYILIKIDITLKAYYTQLGCKSCRCR